MVLDSVFAPFPSSRKTNPRSMTIQEFHLLVGQARQEAAALGLKVRYDQLNKHGDRILLTGLLSKPYFKA